MAISASNMFYWNVLSVNYATSKKRSNRYPHRVRFNKLSRFYFSKGVITGGM